MRIRLISIPALALVVLLPAPSISQVAQQPRQLSEDDLAKIRKSVQSSKARSIQAAAEAERQQQEQARQFEEQQRLAAEAWARQEEDNAQFEAEFEEDRRAKAAAWKAQADRNARALADSLRNLDNTVARVQAQQAEAVRRQQETEREKESAGRRRQVELIDAAAQRQNAEGDRFAAQRGASEQQRAGAKASEAAAVEPRSADRLTEQAAAERARLRQQASAAANPTAARSGEPLRFMLTLGLRNPINGQNGVCFSNVVQLSGPAGWPAEGEATRAAMTLIEPYRARMRQACAAKAQLQDSAPAEIFWNARSALTPPEEMVRRWRAARQIEVAL